MRIKTIIPYLPVVAIATAIFVRCFYADNPQDAAAEMEQTIQFDWPAIGQAAIGTLAEGFLARSPGDEKPRPTASMAKLITALAILEKQPFRVGEEGETYSITAKDMVKLRGYVAEGGSVLPLRIGMKLTQRQAMLRMLIASDNVVADILVQRIFASQENYVTYARTMLKRMRLGRTVVADASGFNPATVSTPRELVAIGIAALQNPVIATIVCRQQVWLPVAGLVKNTNLLLGSHGVIGIKTGTTRDAGSCLLFAAAYADKTGKKVTIVGVIMGDKDHPSLYRDSKELLASAKKRCKLEEIQAENTIVAALPKPGTDQPFRH